MRSKSSSGIQACHDKIVNPQPVNLGGKKEYSAKVGCYKVPNINYNTALRSSRRPNRRDLEDEEQNYYQR